MSHYNPIEKDEKSKNYQKAIQNVVDHLKCKKAELCSELNSDEREKYKILKEISHLQDKLSILEANIKKKSDFTKEYDKAITQSEKNFSQLLKSSEDFLSLTRREALALSHVIQEGGKPPQDEHHKHLSKAPPSTECPPAILAINPPEPGGCANCSNATPCATIMVPFRANGL